MKYPTNEKGIPISTQEIWLPNSELDLSKKENINNHHTCYTAREFGGHVITRVLRTIETHQERLPIDVHDYLHGKYEPPKVPTPRQAMEEIERAKDAGERLKIKKHGHYIITEITDKVLKACIQDYDKLKRR